MLVAVTTFTVASVLVVLLPGPDTLVVIRNLMAGGPRLGLRASLGAMTGLAVWVVAAALGLSALLTASHDGYLALRIVGAAYLCWMGFATLRAKPHSSPDVVAEPRRSLIGTGYTAGLLTDLLNPKVGVFFVSFLPSFIPEGAPVVWTSLLLGGIFVVLTAVYYGALLALSGPVMRWMADGPVRRWVDRVTGLVLIAFGVRMAVEP
ncbi:LysE family translocator [Frankia sp. CNm7]|uniref:LysE family translocator n=1 Tax=Frankia nepalensis TaxID=1836974 RepID=A0A937RDA7_9ACTN|nr:LysE family translocator [Frankia nepalensis]MBL7495869.1 LysE family translocator [Frankia nepalensis]MBL7510404.1 LysE family translocator [Frankia nepalensis]MBL7524747.1 LysE family translocator [Frankia nepalensis]MBL7630003.1 LysE family translocator [Frankia nepalensis]